MGLIYCIIGKSGSGKDALLRALLSIPDIEIVPIIPFTTRPKRSGERDGISYNFVTAEEMKKLEDAGKIIEKREYDTIQGRWCYFTSASAIDSDKDHIIITTPEAVGKIAAWAGDANICVVRLLVDDGLRFERLLARERELENPDYKELARRYLADEIDFEGISLEGLDVINIDMEKSITDCARTLQHEIDKRK